MATPTPYTPPGITPYVALNQNPPVDGCGCDSAPVGAPIPYTPGGALSAASLNTAFGQLQYFVNDAAAIAAGLKVGDLYLLDAGNDVGAKKGTPAIVQP